MLWLQNLVMLLVALLSFSATAEEDNFFQLSPRMVNIKLNTDYLYLGGKALPSDPDQMMQQSKQGFRLMKDLEFDSTIPENRWIKLLIDNNNKTSMFVWVRFQKPMFGQLQFLIVEETKGSGNAVSAANQVEISSSLQSLPLKVPNGRFTVYFRLMEGSSIGLPISIWTYEMASNLRGLSVQH